MHQVKDPSLFFSIYVHKYLPDSSSADDPRLTILEAVDSFAQSNELEPTDQVYPCTQASEIDLVRVARSGPDFRPLLNLSNSDEKAPCQCLVYSHADTLIVQVLIGRVESQAGTLFEGWSDLLAKLQQGFDQKALQATRHNTFGTSLVYWAMVDKTCEPKDYSADIPAIAGDSEIRCTETDIGLLWRSDLPVFSEAPDVPQDCWVLVTPDSKEDEEKANNHFYAPKIDGPPVFAIVALAHHKFSFECAEYTNAQESLESMRRGLDRRSRWNIDTQRQYGNKLADLRTHESVEFQGKLARTITNLADFNQIVSRTREMRRTLDINHRNFLVHCVALISSLGTTRIESSVRQELTASEYLEEWGKDHEEEIFRTELGIMKGFQDQLRADIDYSEQVIERHAASVQAGTEQLRIAGAGELSELSRYNALQAGVMIAALIAYIAVQLLGLTKVMERDPLLAANLMLLTLSAAFACVQSITGRGRAKTWLNRGSFALTCGFLIGSLTVWIWGEKSLAFSAANIVVVAGASTLSWLGYRYFELQSLQRRRARRKQKVEESATFDKLIYAAEELPDLLEDLPPTTSYRLKEEGSLVTKIKNKNESRAAERGITLAELEKRKEDYKLRDLGDAIGIRYVVGPPEIADLVARIRNVAHPVKIEYMNRSVALGQRAADLSGQVEDDPNYRGKYRGFRMKYKSIHIDVDLWGVGARKDVNLLAEIQVRTPIQHLFANWFHDIMYKEAESIIEATEEARTSNRSNRIFSRSYFQHLATCAKQANDAQADSTAPWFVRFFDQWQPCLNRPVAYTLIWLGDLELYLFGKLMDWEDPKDE